MADNASTDPTQDARDRLRRCIAKVVFGLAALLALALAVVMFVSKDEPQPDRALAAAALAILALTPVALFLIPSADLQAALGRVKSVTVGALGIELGDYVGLAGESERSEEDGVETGDSLLDLRIGLEMKLAYLAKHVFAPQPDPNAGELIPEFLTIGSLRRDGYLTKEHTRIAYDILTMRSYELRSLTEQERQLFLAGAKNFVNSLLPEVFSAQVKKTLEKAHWRVLVAFPERRLRRDLIVQSEGSDGTQHHVIPVFTKRPDSTLFKTPRERLQQKPFTKSGGSCFLVVPPLFPKGAQDYGAVRDGISEPPREVRILRLGELLTALERST